MVKQNNHEKFNEEEKWQVPDGWKEDDTTLCEILAAQSYRSAMSGLKEQGPSMSIKTTIANQPSNQC